MSNPEDDETLRQAFADFAGEMRYRWFVGQLQGSWPAKQRLYYWQERLLEAFTAKTGLALPPDYEALKAFFADVFPHHELAEADMPDWCHVEHLEAPCPVQGWGTCDGFAWFFRARWDSWSLAVSLDPSLDPIDIDDVSEGFYHEELYREARYSAGWMELDEARYFLIRTLERFREERRSAT